MSEEAAFILVPMATELSGTRETGRERGAGLVGKIVIFSFSLI
jgi:hypothetical protein